MTRSPHSVIARGICRQAVDTVSHGSALACFTEAPPRSAPSRGRRAARSLVVLTLVGLMSGCGGENGGSSGTGGAGGMGGMGGTGGEPPLLDEYVLADQELVPESGAFDPNSRSFFVGSATNGRITRIEADGTETIFFSPAAGESWRTLGMAVDAGARRLWVCAQEGTTGAVRSQRIWTFDLSSGAQELDLDLANAAEGSTCNDVAVDSAGQAYISDSANPRIYRASAGDEDVIVWADDPLLAPEAAGFGGNGIAVTEDDASVILSKTLATTTTPRLLRIDRTNPANIGGLTTTPDLSGLADGMSFLDGDLYVALVGDGVIARLTSGDDWETATVTSTMAVAGTSTVRPAEGRPYAIYSDITAAILGQPLSPPFRIFRIDVDSFE